LLEVVPEEALATAANEAKFTGLPVPALPGLPDGDSCNGAAQFHIADSNMSEAGYSECSLQSEHVLNCRQALTKTEALSAKQQVGSGQHFNY
jgi:hypothetical protein